MIKKLRKSIDGRGTLAAIFTGMSVTIDFLPHGLLIAKLCTYGVKFEFLNLLFYYLSHRKQRIRLNNTYNKRTDIYFLCHKDLYSVPCYLIYFHSISFYSFIYLFFFVPPRFPYIILCDPIP